MSCSLYNETWTYYRHVSRIGFPVIWRLRNTIKFVRCNMDPPLCTTIDSYGIFQKYSALNSISHKKREMRNLSKLNYSFNSIKYQKGTQNSKLLNWKIRKIRVEIFLQTSCFSVQAKKFLDNSRKIALRDFPLTKNWFRYNHVNINIKFIKHY